AQYGIKVSSNSWGCIGGCPYEQESFEADLQRQLYAAGIVTVFAAGNDGGNPSGDNFSGDSQSPFVLSVAAYDDESDRLADFSSRGEAGEPLPNPETWTPEGEEADESGADDDGAYRRPDLSAPGVDIWSARSLTGGTAAGPPRVNVNDVLGGGSGGFVPYTPVSGTSMATPHVSGAAAVLLGACPSVTPLDVMRAIKVGADSARVLNTGGSGVAEAFETGYGGLDVRASLDRLLALPTCGGSTPWQATPDPDPTPTPNPTPTPTTTPTPAPVGDVIFEEEGFIEASSLLVGITLGDFLVNCAEPTTQGLDGYAFHLPAATGAREVVTVTGSGSEIPHDLDLFFYDAECSETGDPVATEAPDEIAFVPNGTEWIFAHAFTGLQTTATLTVYSGETGTSPSPSPTPTESASPSPSQTAQPETTTVSLENSHATGQYSDETYFEARVTDSDGDPIPGAEVTFGFIESSRSFAATTDDNGVASVSPTLTEQPGPYNLTAHYAGDEDHAGSSTTTAFLIAKEDTDLKLTVEGKGNNRVLEARLSDRDTPSDGVAGRIVDLNADGEFIGSTTTDDNGIATLQPPPRYRGGKHDFEARFEGDDYYRASSDVERS
ncbi:MAG: S8 family serine peptidase, partial [Gaiellales bacterium]